MAWLRRPPRIWSRLLLLLMVSLVFILLTLMSGSSWQGQQGGGLDLGSSMWLALSLFHSPPMLVEVPEPSTGPPILGPECDALFAGNQEEIKFTKDMLYKESRRGISDQDYIRGSRNCDQFLQKRGYRLEPRSKEEEAFPIAYILTVHRNSEQVERLLRAVYAPQNVYCIHMDKKSPASFQSAISAIAKCFRNVILVSEPLDVVYAGYTRLQADVNCMKDLLKSDVAWKYAINLCGQDFPLRINQEIVHNLKDLNGANDIAGVEPKQQNLIDRYKYKHEVETGDEQKVIRRTKELNSPPPKNITIYFGNAYNLFTRGFVDFVINDSFAQEVLHWMEDVYSPDEFYWTTMQYLPGTPGGASTPSWTSMARVIKWKMFVPHMYPECQGYYQRGICVFGVGDLYWLYMQHHLFANKFDMASDHVAIGCLELLLNDRVLHQKEYHPSVSERAVSSLDQEKYSSLHFHGNQSSVPER